MNIHQEISSTLQRESGGIDMPELEIGELLVVGKAEVRRRNTRHVFAGGLACVLLGAVGLSVYAGQLGTTDRGADEVGQPQPPATVAELPVGGPPESAWCSDGVLRWKGEVRALPSGDCAWPFRVTQVGDVGLASDGPLLMALDGSGIRTLPYQVDSESSPLVISGDGSLGGWVTGEPRSRQELVLWSMDDMREVATVAPPTEDQLNLEGIDAEGRVFFTSSGGATTDGAWVWNASGDNDVHRVTGVRDYVTLSYVTPGGLVFILEEREGAPDRIIQGTVTESGEFVANWSGALPRVSFAPDLRHFVSTSRTEVVDAETGDAVRLQLPDDAVVWADPVWESDKALLVLVQVSFMDYALLRCDSESGACEIAAESRGPNVSFPESSGYNIPD